MLRASKRWMLFAVVAGALCGCGGSDDAGGGMAPLPPPPPPPPIGSAGVALAAPTNGAQRIDLAWSVSGSGAVAIAEFRVLLKRSDGAAFEALAAGIAPTTLAHSLTTTALGALSWPQARVKVQACDAAATCIDSNEQPLLEALLGLVRYVKASNTDAGDQFGASVALSADGSTLAIGAYGEDSSATGMNGSQGRDDAADSGAVYVLVHDAGTWRQQAYLKGPAVAAGALFGFSVALSADGNTLAVGAYLESNTALGVLGNRNGAAHVFVRDGSGVWSQQAHLQSPSPGMDDRFGVSVALSAAGDLLAIGADAEDSSAVGIDGDSRNNGTPNSGAVYLFERAAGVWTPVTYVKASNTGANDTFGLSVALSGDGRTLAVGAPGESSAATGVDGDQVDNSTPGAGAVYVFKRATDLTWAQSAYLKSSNTDAGDAFGVRIALAADGSTLAVGANGEDSGATGIDGDQAGNTATNSGAVYVFLRTTTSWAQQAYIKAFNTDANDRFGSALALSADGNTLLVAASGEGSNAVGIGGDASDNSVANSGAAYVFGRMTDATWSQRFYVKAPNPDAGDFFGIAAAMSGDGATFAVGALFEASAATGIDGNRDDNSAAQAGAVYLF